MMVHYIFGYFENNQSIGLLTKKLTVSSSKCLMGLCDWMVELTNTNEMRVDEE